MAYDKELDEILDEYFDGKDLIKAPPEGIRAALSDLLRRVEVEAYGKGWEDCAKLKEQRLKALKEETDERRNR